MSDANSDRINRLEDRQNDQEVRVGILERMVEINAERLTEERNANADERKASRIERIIIIVAVAGAVAAPYIASLFGGGEG